VRVVEAELHLAAAGGFLTQAAVRADFVEVEVFVLADDVLLRAHDVVGCGHGADDVACSGVVHSCGPVVFAGCLEVAIRPGVECHVVCYWLEQGLNDRGVFRWFSVARLSNGSNEFEATM
jgi:hypothetical protein